MAGADQQQQTSSASGSQSGDNARHSAVSTLQWAVLALLFFSTVVNYLDRQTLSVLKETLNTGLGLTNVQYGYITGLFMVVYSIAGVGVGMWIDRVGVRWGLGLSVLLWSAASIFQGFVRGPVSLGLARGLMAVGEGANWPAGGKAVARWLPPERRAFAMGVFDGGSAVGAILAPPLVGGLTLYIGWRATFVAIGLLGIVWLVAWIWIYDDPSRHRWLSSRDRDDFVAKRQSEATKGMSMSQGAGLLLRMRSLWGLAGVRFIATPVWWFYVFWLPAYLQRSLGFTLADVACFAWIPYLTADAGKLLGGWASDRLLQRGASPSVARKSVMIVGAVCMAMGMFVTRASGPGMAMTLASTATLGFGFWSSNTLALHADCFPSRLMASALGLTGMAAALGGAAFTSVVGLTVDWLGYGYLFLIAGLAPLLASVILVFGVGRAGDGLDVNDIN